MAEPRLPAGYTARPLDPAADLPAVHRLVRDREHALHGTATGDEGALAAVLARDGFDPAADTVLVHAPDGRLAAWAWSDRRSECEVHPRHQGRGLDAALLTWIEQRAREQGVTEVARNVPERDTATTALLTAHGYRTDVTSWLLAVPLDAVTAPPPPPEGITVRMFRPGDPDDEQQAHRLTEDAFADWRPRRQPFREWAQHTVHRATFAPERSPLAFADGRMVGAALALALPGDEGYLETMAVDRAHRRRGIAGHLLHHTFHACRTAGLRAATLWTHSGTGALDLYLKAGMTVRHSSVLMKRSLVD